MLYLSGGSWINKLRVSKEFKDGDINFEFTRK